MNCPFKLLLIDDSPANLTLLIEYLTQADFQLFVAENGPSALERLQYVQPDLILLDILMPGMSGFAVCKAIKANPRTCHIPVIFLTARDETADKLKGFAVGGVDYITKPLIEAEVLARVRAHLQIAQSNQRLSNENLRLQQQLSRQTAAPHWQNAAATDQATAPPAPMLRLQLLGPFTLLIGDEERTAFRSDAVRALLAYLVLEGQTPLDRAQLAYWFWPTYLPHTRLNSLRVALHNLRQLLQPLDQLLVADRKTVRFYADPTQVWCDALPAITGDPGLLRENELGVNQVWRAAQSGFLPEFDQIESNYFQQWRRQRQAYYTTLTQP